jgi:hypothetical protein
MRSPPPRRLPCSASVLLALALALAGCGAGGGGETSTPPQGDEVRAGAAILAPPPEWRRARVPAAFSETGLRGAVALEPEPIPTGIPPGDAGMVLGRHDMAGASPLAPGLEELVTVGAADVADAETVRLGSLEAYWYSATDTEKGFERVVVYAVPTTRGVVNVVCYVRSAVARWYIPTCQEVAAGMRLAGAQPLPVAPSATYASDLRGVLETLNDRREQGVRTLRAARTPGRQRAAATRLAALHADAAGALREMEPPPTARGAHREIVGSLTSIASTYRGLARAIRRQDRAAYREASTRVRTAEAAANAALDRLGALGYATA